MAEKWWRSGTAVVVSIALGTVVVHVATGWRYGFDRDELMAMDDARHLAWGYVQYPPVTAFLGRVASVLFGTSLVGFRFFAAAAMAVAVVLTGLMAKEMGGGKWAQVVAAMATVPFCLGAGALMQYISFDYVCWVGVAWCVTAVVSGEWRVTSKETKEQLESEDAAKERNSKMESRPGGTWWVGVGVGIGLGMMTKYTMGFLAVGVVVGVLCTPMRRYLKSGWLWLGVLVSVVIFLPNLWWQWTHGFVSLEFLRFLHARDVATGQTDWFLPGQLEITLLAFPLAVAGLAFCCGMGVNLEGSGEGRVTSVERHRILGWMYVVPLGLFLVMRGRNYYLAPAYPMLYAAGAVWVEDKWRVKRNENRNWESGSEVEGYKSGKVEEKEANAETQNAQRFAAKPERPSTFHFRASLLATRHSPLVTSLRRVVWVALILDVVVAGAVALPIAPVNSAWWKLAVQVDGVFREEIGWEEFVSAVAAVRDRLPEADRAQAGILAGNYGEVGALNLYGKRFGLPPAISGVNSSWERGYGDPPDVVIVVGYPRALLEKEFASCVVGGRVWNRYGVMNEETIEDPEIFVCRGLKGSWEEFWRKVRKFA
jgi:4-amino-4-deoxy-L-arabinose transferase-like glycosyltransferase